MPQYVHIGLLDTLAVLVTQNKHKHMKSANSKQEKKNIKGVVRRAKSSKLGKEGKQQDESE